MAFFILLGKFTSMTALGGKFYSSVSVFFAVLYISSSPFHAFNLHSFVRFGFESIHKRGKRSNEPLQDEFT